jgi:hypothetical protein
MAELRYTAQELDARLKGIDEMYLIQWLRSSALRLYAEVASPPASAPAATSAPAQPSDADSNSSSEPPTASPVSTLPAAVSAKAWRKVSLPVPLSLAQVRAAAWGAPTLTCRALTATDLDPSVVSTSTSTIASPTPARVKRITGKADAQVVAGAVGGYRYRCSFVVKEVGVGKVVQLLQHTERWLKWLGAPFVSVRRESRHYQRCVEARPLLFLD